jgi:hypothetical protein
VNDKFHVPAALPQEIEITLSSVSGSFLLGLIFETVDGGDMFLRNVGLSPNYTALQPREPQSWKPTCYRYIALSRCGLMAGVCKLKVKLSLCLIKHYVMKTYGEWRYGSTILNLDTIWG